MNLQYLHSFYVTVKANSISKAAKMLFLTQPGLSMQLQALEKELGSQLLIRSNKGVELTKEGQVVFNYADKILTLKDNIDRELDAVKSSREELIISCCKSIGDYALPCTLYLYKKAHEMVDIDLKVCSSSEVIKDLSELTSHVGITQTIASDPNLCFESFFASDMALVCSPSLSNQLPKDTALSTSQLKEIPIILPTEGSGCRQEIFAILAEKGIDAASLNVVFESNSLEAIKSTVISGKGAAFFPTFAIQKELAHQMLMPIEIEDCKFTSTFYLVHRKDYTLAPYEKDFVELICSPKRGFCS